MTDSASTAYFFFLKKRIRNKRERYAVSVLLRRGMSGADILKETGLSQPGSQLGCAFWSS
jgi:hypothetical protein